MIKPYQLIQTVNIDSGGAASITFSNIPQNYTDLLIKFSTRTNQGGIIFDTRLRINDIASASYSERMLRGDGSSTGSFNQSGGNFAWVYTQASGTANTFSSCDVFIPNYTSSGIKSVLIDGVSENNATESYQWMVAALWNISSPVTSISYTPNGGTFAQYSTASLYGLGGASATGGTITSDSLYTYHTFTSSGTFMPLENIKNAEVLVIAGGGGGGNNIGGGGGASASYQSGINIQAAVPSSVIVGAGGIYNANGSLSSIFSCSASGGLCGLHQDTNYTNGGNGGAGVYTFGRTITNYTGGTSRQNTGSNRLGGGGAGIAQNGGNSTNATNIGGNGGNGSSFFSNWHLATNTGVLSSGEYFIGGGGAGGGEQNSYTRGAPGLGGGGVAGLGTTQANGSNGSANTGGGGGGAGGTAGVASGLGGSGGSGLVIIRYPNS